MRVENGIEVRTQAAPFIWLYNRMIDEYAATVGVTAVAVYVVLLMYANNMTGECYPSQSTIAKKLGVSKPTIRGALDKLSAAGLIVEEKRIGAPTLYTVTRELTCKDSLLPTHKDSLHPPAKVLCTNYTKRTRLNKPSAAQSETLHARIRTYIQALHEKHFKIACQWDASEGKTLFALIDGNRSWTPEQYRSMIANRFASDAITPERPRVWLANLSKYAAGPLNEFGRTKVSSETKPSSQSEISVVDKVRAQIARKAE